jgi:hypothetical protein
MSATYQSKVYGLVKYLNTNIKCNYPSLLCINFLNTSIYDQYGVHFHVLIAATISIYRRKGNQFMASKGSQWISIIQKSNPIRICKWIIKIYSLVYWIYIWILKNDSSNIMDPHLDLIIFEFESVMNSINK